MVEIPSFFLRLTNTKFYGIMDKSMRIRRHIVNFWESKLDVKSQDIEDKQRNCSIPQEYGLCSKCGHFAYRKTQLMDMEIKCDVSLEPKTWFKTQPRSYDPIIECSHFWARGQMSIEAMSRIAYIIDIKKRQIGFAGQETIEVKITEPKEDCDEK
jgi:hypothetical protein